MRDVLQLVMQSDHSVLAKIQYGRGMAYSACSERLQLLALADQDGWLMMISI